MTKEALAKLLKTAQTKELTDAERQKAGGDPAGEAQAPLPADGLRQRQQAAGRGPQALLHRHDPRRRGRGQGNRAQRHLTKQPKETTHGLHSQVH